MYTSISSRSSDIQQRPEHFLAEGFINAPVTEMDEASEERQGERQQDKCREEKCQVSAGLHYTSASLPVTGLSVVSSPLPQLPIKPYPAGRLP